MLRKFYKTCRFSNAWLLHVPNFSCNHHWAIFSHFQKGEVILKSLINIIFCNASRYRLVYRYLHWSTWTNHSIAADTNIAIQTISFVVPLLRQNVSSLVGSRIAEKSRKIRTNGNEPAFSVTRVTTIWKLILRRHRNTNQYRCLQVHRKSLL